LGVRGEWKSAGENAGESAGNQRVFHARRGVSKNHGKSLN